RYCALGQLGLCVEVVSRRVLPCLWQRIFLLIEQKALETLDELVALSDVPPLPLHLEQLGPDALVSFRRGRLPALVRPLQAGADVIAKSLEHHAPLCSSASHAPCRRGLSLRWFRSCCSRQASVTRQALALWGSCEPKSDFEWISPQL